MRSRSARESARRADRRTRAPAHTRPRLCLAWSLQAKRNTTMKTPSSALLQVQNLTLASAKATVVDDVSFHVRAGEVLGIVGESGSGKTLAVRAIIGLLPHAIRRTAGRIHFEGQDLATLAPRELRRVRGARVGMVFQEPMTSLNPALTIGRQLDEGLAQQTGLSAAQRRER